MLKLGKVSYVSGEKASVFFPNYDDAATVELLVLKQYLKSDSEKINVDDIVLVGYTTDGTGIILGHL